MYKDREKQINIDGVIVFYNPDGYIFENISTYISYLRYLWVVDNSDRKNIKIITKLQKSYKKVKYIDNEGNKGVAYALNVAARSAIKCKATYLLTMDQDSKFRNNDLEIMIKFINERCMKNVGILSPVYDENNKQDKFNTLVTITSGSIINLEIYRIIGGFVNKLFIDEIDTEYCLRLNKLGYKIIRFNDVLLIHQLGDRRSYQVLGFKFYATNHSCIRRYYITRNRFYVWEKYANDFPAFVKSAKKNALKEIIKILLVEKNKARKIWYMIRGYIDYKKNKFGKLNI